METQLKTRANVEKALRTGLERLTTHITKVDRVKAAKEFDVVRALWQDLQQRHVALMEVADEELQVDLQASLEVADRDMRGATAEYEELRSIEDDGGEASSDSGDAVVDIQQVEGGDNPGDNPDAAHVVHSTKPSSSAAVDGVHGGMRDDSTTARREQIAETNDSPAARYDTAAPARTDVPDSLRLREIELSLAERELSLRQRRLELAEREQRLSHSESTQAAKQRSSTASSDYNGEVWEDRRRSQDLPRADLPRFSGAPIEYASYIHRFETVVEEAVRDPKTRLSYLLMTLSGRPKEVVQDCVLIPDTAKGYEMARTRLHRYFGQDHVIVQHYIDQLIKGPALKRQDADGLIHLAQDMSSISTTLTALDCREDLDNRDTLRQIAAKLPAESQELWIREAQALRRRGKKPTFDDLTAFVDDEAAVSNSYYGRAFGKRSDNPNESNQSQRSGHGQRSRVTTSMATSTVRKPPAAEESSASSKKCSACEGTCTRLERCSTFKQMSVKERKQAVFRIRGCLNCFRSGHFAKECRQLKGCQVPDCTLKHHAMMHEWTTPSVTVSATSSSTDCYLGVVPVIIEAGGNIVHTNALLDNGSQKTLCTDSLVERLGASGRHVTFSVNSVNDRMIEYHGRQLDLTARPVNGGPAIQLRKTWTVSHLPVAINHMATAEEIRAWPHLKGVKVPKRANGAVELLIGTDVPTAHAPLETRSGTEAEPYAVKTVLGWSVRGPRKCSPGQAQRSRIPNGAVIGCTSVCEKTSLELRRMYEADFSEKPGAVDSASIEDHLALKTMESSLTVIDGHYQLGLPWRDETPSLPESRPQAEQRLKGLKRRLERDADFKEKYVCTIEDYIAQGHAEPAKKIGDHGRTWYLPHHGVTNPHKPGKIRVVFDAAAKSRGVALNDALLRGPDLVNDLVGVLVRFRQGRVALAADIKQMFHQVRVQPSDRDALRFLWWPRGDTSQPPQVYRMAVHVFGATSSPSCSAFALRRAALDQRGEFPTMATDTVLKSFYVDDCLKSVETSDEAKQLIEGLTRMLANRGFALEKWMCTDHHVMETVPKNIRSGSTRTFIHTDHLPQERALGLAWDLEADGFRFEVQQLRKPVTRRGILSEVSSIFDPLGLVAPVILPGKLLLQELCRDDLKWDDSPSQSQAARWRRWVSSLDALKFTTIPRHYAAGLTAGVSEAQLHVFADASEHGYGACAYLRLTDATGAITCQLVLGKSRVAPLKTQTLPRLELTSAVVGARLVGQCARELELPIEHVTLWSDSMIVLGYIANRRRRFKTFVANRLAAIFETTEPKQWRHVEGKLNPADLASRGIEPDNQAAMRLWLNGPAFLYKPESEWPSSRPASETPEDDPELKRDVAVTATVAGDDLIDRIMLRYSSLSKLVRHAAWWRRAAVRRHGNDPLTAEELASAEASLVRFVQRTCLTEDYRRLSSGDTPKKSSRLGPLSPKLEDGLIIVGGRLQFSELSDGAKHPKVMPEKHHLTALIIRAVHEDQCHSGTSHVLASVRQHYWVLRGRAAVKRQLQACLMCRRLYRATEDQQMAPLVKERLTPNQPPFTYVGVDYFGPLYVKCRRSTVKRWGCIFTCLATRAVHVELAHSMTAASFISALQRFTSRRGRPRVVYSDNGTNFVGAEREIRKELMSWIADVGLRAADYGIDWRFNPPHASHRGGATERMIRAVRRVLIAVTKDQLLTDEQMSTAMCEAERVVNDRPLTYVGDDPADPEVLTPAKLLLLKTNTCLPMGDFTADDHYATRWWRRAQHVANVFWKRWLREYVQTLQDRPCWRLVRENLKAGDVVLIRDLNAPRGQWPLGVVTETEVSRDGLVRAVQLRSRGKIVRRPVTQLVNLEDRKA